MEQKTTNILQLDADSDEYSGQVNRAVNTIVTSALLNCKGGPVEHIQVGMSAVIGAIMAIAPIVGHRADVTDESSIEEMKSTVNDVSILVTALLAVRSAKDKGDTLSMHLNPIIYLTALKAAEKLLGYAPDGMINPGMVNAARKWEQEKGYSGEWNAYSHEDNETTNRGPYLH